MDCWYLHVPRIPLIEDLTSGPIPAGSVLIVEYDPASQWYNASVTMTAGWVRTGGRIDYSALSQPPDDVRAQLRRLGLDLESLEKDGRLIFTDWYTPTLGQKSRERDSHSLKVADLSIYLAQAHLRHEPEPDLLMMTDDESTFARFNDERPWMELELTRFIPGYKVRKQRA